MAELGYIPGVAISRAITAKELMRLDARPYEPVIVHNRLLLSGDTLYWSPYGMNSYSDSVVTWEDDRQRTILGFDPYGLMKQDGEVMLPNDTELNVAMQKVASYVMDTLQVEAGIVVHATPVELR